MKIGIDLLSSDCSASSIFIAIQQAAQSFPEVSFLLFTTEKAFQSLTIKKEDIPTQIEFFFVTDEIYSTDNPSCVIEEKLNSSIGKGISFLNENRIDAFVSAGHTGALLMAATLKTPLLPQVIRPALIATLPTYKHKIALVDVGANIVSKIKELIQFTHLGIAYAQSYHGLSIPRVGILNIGTEANKGPDPLRQLYQYLHQQQKHNLVNFIGNVEAKDLFNTAADVIITDGFTGNIVLKTIESCTNFLLQEIKKNKDLVENINMQPILASLAHKFSLNQYNGALLGGLTKIVVKCHGYSSSEGFYEGVKKAIYLVQNNCLAKMKTYFSSIHSDYS